MLSPRTRRQPRRTTCSLAANLTNLDVGIRLGQTMRREETHHSVLIRIGECILDPGRARSLIS